MTRQSRTTTSRKTWITCACEKPNDKTSDTNDDVTTKTNTVHMKRDTWQVSVLVVFLLVLFRRASSSSLIAHHIAWLNAQGSACLHSSHPCMKWASLFDFELSIPSNFFFFSFSFNLPQFLLPFYFHEDSSNTVYSANKETGSTDESYSRTSLCALSNPICFRSVWCWRTTIQERSSEAFPNSKELSV